MRTLKTSEATLLSHIKADWDTLLPHIVFAYNTAPHATTGYSPFFLAHGRSAALPIDRALQAHSTLAPEAFTSLAPDELHAAQEQHATTFKSTLAQANKTTLDARTAQQAKSKDRRDKNLRDVQYKVADLVWLYIPMYSALI
eukprot:Opistho-2@31761